VTFWTPIPPPASSTAVQVTFVESNARNPIAMLLTFTLTDTAMLGAKYSPVQVYTVDAHTQVAEADEVLTEPLPETMVST
jgi:hypothetical protein